MGLTAALRTASSALALNSAQSAIVAKNIGAAGDTNYSRRIGEVVTLGDGGARLVRIERAADPSLQTTLLAATSKASASSAQSIGLTQLAQTVGDTTDTTSPTARLSAFGAALQTYASSPSDASASSAAIAAARSLAQGLNDASAQVQTVREDADAKMSASVDTINALLADFDKSNAAVVAGTSTGTDITDALDTRDATLKALANEIGVGTVSRKDGSLAIYTDSGVTLDDGGARAVTMRASTALPAGSAGAAVTVDGVAVTGPHAPMPIRSGALAGLAQLRDTIAPQYGTQLDGIAGGLVSAFAEQPQSGGGPGQAGLFTWGGAPALPTGTASGIAGSIGIAAGVDPDEGGDVTKLRDGGIAGAGYVANQAGGASYSAHLQQLADGLDATRTFDGSAGIGANNSLTTFANASVGWLSAQRQAASNAADANTALSTQAAQALSNTTGVNLDDQMSQMLALENAYGASAKLLNATNTMMQSLLSAIAMSVASLSSLSLIDGLRGPIQNLQTQLTQAQTELSTGRKADVGLALGARTGDASALHGLCARLDAFTNGNAVATTRMTATQDALSNILDTATSLQQSVVGALAGTATPEVIATDAQSGLSSVVSALNTTAAGQNLFAGINTDAQPLADGGDKGKQSITDAFTAAFGMSPGDAGAVSITPAAMKTFLDGAFAQQFASPNWQANWSSASDAEITSRISPTQTATTSISANTPALRQVVQVAAMLSQLGLSSLSADTRQTVLTQASDDLGRTTADVTTLQANLGTTQKTVAASTDQMTQTSTFIDTQIGALEDVDPAEVSTRIASLTSQLESAYTLTGKLSQLSLVHFLP